MNKQLKSIIGVVLALLAVAAGAYGLANMQDSRARANTPFLRARTWSFAVTSKISSDLALTQLVLETNPVVALPVVEGQIGLRFNLGHGRIPGESK